jgi:hypothetical protein
MWFRQFFIYWICEFFFVFFFGVLYFFYRQMTGIYLWVRPDLKTREARTEWKVLQLRLQPVLLLGQTL